MQFLHVKFQQKFTKLLNFLNNYPVTIDSILISDDIENSTVVEKVDSTDEIVTTDAHRVNGGARGLDDNSMEFKQYYGLLPS
jgi:hypothetical protein